MPQTKKRRLKKGSELAVFRDDEEDAVARKLMNRRRNVEDDGENADFHISKIDKEDDEEIDEDEAFNEEDEMKYGSFFGRNGDIDDSDDAADILDEDPDGAIDADENFNDEYDEDDEDGDNGTGGFVMDALSSKPTSKSSSDFVRVLMPVPTHDSDEYVFDMEEQDADDDIDESTTLEGENDDDLADFVAGLDPKQGFKKKRKLPEISEVYDESEFNLRIRDSEANSRVPIRRKIELSDLVGSIGNGSSFVEVRKQLEAFEKVGAKGKTKVAVEPIPLPRRMQSRLKREAAYDVARKELNKWVPAVKKNREADQLSFPDSDPHVPTVTSSELVGKFVAETTMEQEIAQILEESNLTEKKQMRLEDMELNEIDADEVAARRAELARIRSLLFYQEQKQRKIAKIKSKAYRKIRKKERERKALSLEELAEVDPESAREKLVKLEAQRIPERLTLKHKNTGKWAKQMLSRNDRGAESRQAIMEQLNRGQDLKRKIAGLDDSNDDEDSSDDSVAEYNVDEDQSISARRKALDSLGIVEEDIDLNSISKSSSLAPAKGLMAMKFMQRAVERQEKETRAMLQDARKRVESGDLNSDDEADYRSRIVDVSHEDDITSDGEGDVAGANRIAARNIAYTVPQNNGGRLSFGVRDAEKGEEIKKRTFEPLDNEDSSSGASKFLQNEHYLRVSGPVSIHIPTKAPAAALSPIFETADFADDDAMGVQFDGKISRADFKKTADTAPLPQPENPAVSLSKSEKKRSTGKAGLKEVYPPAMIEESTLESMQGKTSSNPWLTDVNSAPIKKTKKLKNGSSKTPSSQFGNAAKTLEKLSAIKKKSILQESVAAEKSVVLNLDIVRSMETSASQPAIISPAPSIVKRDPSKKRINNTLTSTFNDDISGSDSEVDLTTLDGSRSKRGELTQRDILQMAFANDDVLAEFEEEKQKIIDADAPKDEDMTLPGWGGWSGVGIAPKVGVVVKKVPGVDLKKRKDAGKKHVIISERRNRKTAKLMTPDVPFGFETREQYEQTMRIPLGKDWNSAASHNRLIAPKVVTKMGRIIAPMSKKEKKQSKNR